MTEATLLIFPELYIYCFIVLIIYTTAAAAFEHYQVNPIILSKKTYFFMKIQKSSQF